MTVQTVLRANDNIEYFLYIGKEKTLGCGSIGVYNLSLFPFVFSFLEEEEDDDEGAELNSSAPVMSETEDDDDQISKKDVSLFSHDLCVITGEL